MPMSKSRANSLLVLSAIIAACAADVAVTSTKIGIAAATSLLIVTTSPYGMLVKA